jgi:hypothetical protein
MGTIMLWIFAMIKITRVLISKKIVIPMIIIVIIERTLLLLKAIFKLPIVTKTAKYIIPIMIANKAKSNPAINPTTANPIASPKFSAERSNEKLKKTAILSGSKKNDNNRKLDVNNINTPESIFNIL